MDILFFSVLCLLCLCTRLFICALWSPAGKGLTSWLSFVVSNYVFVTFPLVSWVRCGTRLYRLLIFAPLLTLVDEFPSSEVHCYKDNHRHATYFNTTYQLHGHTLEVVYSSKYVGVNINEDVFNVPLIACVGFCVLVLDLLGIT